MAGATQHKSSTKGPLLGIYMAFDLPIKEDKKDADASDKETLYCKECIGKFLGLTVAKARVITVKKGAKGESDKKRAGRAAKGQKSFKILLKTGTKIDAQGIKDKSKITKEVDSITVSFPNTVSVAELREYFMTKSSAKDKIVGFITPSGRTHYWTGPLGDKSTAVETSTTG